MDYNCGTLAQPALLCFNAVYARKIDETLEGIALNRRKIKNLLKERDGLTREVQSALHHRAKNGQALTCRQMAAYRGFCRYADSKEQNLASTMALLKSAMTKCNLHHEIVKSHAALDVVYSQLADIEKLQRSVIAALGRFVLGCGAVIRAINN